MAVKRQEGATVATKPQQIPTYSMKVRLTFTTECLGSLPSDPAIFEKFIASQAPDAATREEEVAAIGIEEVVRDGRTIFSRSPNNKEACLRGYQICGFFKNAATRLKELPNMLSTGLKAHKKLVDNFIFVDEDYIPIYIPNENGGEMGICERSLRAQTAQGERISLTSSETVPAGAYVDFTVTVLDEKYLNFVREWLNYGSFNGLGQWRNSGKGRFTWEEI